MSAWREPRRRSSIVPVLVFALAWIGLLALICWRLWVEYDPVARLQGIVNGL